MQLCLPTWCVASMKFSKAQGFENYSLEVQKSITLIFTLLLLSPTEQSSKHDVLLSDHLWVAY
jgi:hypothetical protein